MFPLKELQEESSTLRKNGTKDAKEFKRAV